MTRLHIDESVVNSVLSGVLLLLVAAWALWAVGWLLRVELRREVEPLVAALGLRFAAEGLGPSVRADGAVGGVRVQLRWRRGLLGETRVSGRVGDGGWERLSDAGVRSWIDAAATRSA